MTEYKFDKLSIEHCQKVLKKSGIILTDEQVEKVRDFLYLLAEIEYERYKKEQEENVVDSELARRDAALLNGALASVG